MRGAATERMSDHKGMDGTAAGRRADVRATAALSITRPNGFNPTEILRDFDWGKTRRLAERPGAARVDDLVASDKEIEVAPGVNYPAWTYNGRVPGPDASLPRGRAAADPVRQRLGAPAHDPLPRHPPGRDGRRARGSAPG